MSPTCRVRSFISSYVHHSSIVHHPSLVQHPSTSHYSFIRGLVCRQPPTRAYQEELTGAETECETIPASSTAVESLRARLLLTFCAAVLNDALALDAAAVAEEENKDDEDHEVEEEEEEEDEEVEAEEEEEAELALAWGEASTQASLPVVGIACTSPRRAVKKAVTCERETERSSQRVVGESVHHVMV